MKPLYFILLVAGLLLGSCGKGGDEPTPTPQPQPEPEKPLPPTPPTPPAPLSPAQQLVGEWRLIKLAENEHEEKLYNCNRYSSISFSEQGTATRTTYQYTPTTDAQRPNDDCKFVAQALTYTATTQQLVLNNLAGTATETHTYSIVSNTLVMVYKSSSGATQSVTYQKDYVYDPAKEVLGTWYINSLWRNDIYNYDSDLEKFDGCRTRQKVVITKDSITIEQWRYTKKQCREFVYKGTYTLSKGKGIFIVKNRLKGKENIGLREFRVGNGTLELWGFVNGLGGDYENEFYKHEQKYK